MTPKTSESLRRNHKPPAGPHMPAMPPPPGSEMLARLTPHAHLILHGVLLIAVIGLIIWNVVLKNRAEAERARIREDYQTKITEVVAQKNTDMLQLATVPLAWAIRKEMLRDDWAGVDDYLAQYIKQKNVSEISVAKADGTVQVSTDRKLEGKPFSGRYPSTLLQAQEVAVVTRQDGALVVGAPIMGFAARLGTVALVYLPEKIEVITPQK